MARDLFGGSSDDYAVDTYGKPVTNRRVRFYTSAAMTTEITDLASDAAGTGSPLTVSTDSHGFWGPVYGPDAVTVMYAGAVDAAGNPPTYVVAVYTHTSAVGGVSSFNTRTGDIALSKADVTGTGLAPADVGADASGAAAAVQTNLSSEVTRAQAAEAALGGGMQFRTAVVVATTNQALSALPTVDGVTLTAGQAILLTGQTAGSQNGLWAVAVGAWARPSNFAAGLDATATSVLVESGSAGGGTTYAVTGTSSNVVGTNVLTFVKTSGSAASGGVRGKGFITPKGSLAVWDTARDAAATQLSEVVIIGDSTAYGSSDATAPGGAALYSWVAKLRALSQAAGLTDGGRGIAGNSDTAALSGESLSIVQSITGFAASTGVGVLNTDTFRSTTAADVVTLQGYGSQARLHYNRVGASGRFSYSIDGGASVNIDPALPSPSNSSDDSILLTLPGSPASIHTVAITNAGGRQYDTPTAAPIPTGSNSGGTLPNGVTYFYKYTIAMGGGETPPSPATAGTFTAGGSGSIQVQVNGSAGNGTTYNFYRSTSAGGTYGLIGTATSTGSNAQILDTGSVSPGVAPPSTNTAGLNASNKTVAVSVEFMKSTGIVYHKNAVSGTSYQTWFVGDGGVSTYNSEAALALGLGPQPGTLGVYGWLLTPGAGPRYRKPALAICALGINNMSDANTDNIEKGVETFIKMARAAGADPLIVIPHLQAAANAQTFGGQVRRAIYAIAESHSCALVDFDEALGPINTWVSKNYIPSGYVLTSVGKPHLGQFAYDAEATFLWNNVLSPSAPRS